MDSHSDFLGELRNRLEKKGLPQESTDSLVEMFGALLTTMGVESVNEEDLVSRLADVVVENGNLLALIQQQAAELDALRRITLNLTSSLELQVVLEEVVREAMKLVRDANDAHIFLYEGHKLVFGTSLNADGSKNEQYREQRPNGLTHHIARTREMLVVEDMQDHPLYHDVDADWKGSIIGLPLKMGDRVIGVMNLARNRTGKFTQSEIRLLTLLADQASIAIINARLHQVVSQQAHVDVLTGLPNRRALDKRLDEEIKDSAGSGRVFCVIMMDLDNFKAINDTYGHDVGDEVLRQVAHSLQESLRASDFIARYGGDELTLVLPDTDLNQSQVVIEKVKQSFNTMPVQLPDGKTTTMTVSGGIALYPEHTDTAPGLLRAADEACYRAKRGGGGIFLVAQNLDA